MEQVYSGGRPRLRAARIACGITTERLAQLTGLSRSTIYRVEHGLVPPNRATRTVLAAALGRPYDDHLFDVDEEVSSDA